MSLAITEALVQQLCVDAAHHDIPAILGETVAMSRLANRLCRQVDGQSLPMACLQLVAEKRGLSFDKKNAIKISCVSAKTHDKTVRALVERGVVKKEASLRDVSVQLGKEVNIRAVEELIRRVGGRLRTVDVRWAAIDVETDRGIMGACIFHMAKKLAGPALSKGAICSCLGISTRELTSAIDTVATNFKDDINDIAVPQGTRQRQLSTGAASKRKQKNQSDDKQEGAQDAGSQKRKRKPLTSVNKTKKGEGLSSGTLTSIASTPAKAGPSKGSKRAEEILASATAARRRQGDVLDALQAVKVVEERAHPTIMERFDVAETKREAARARLREKQAKKDIERKRYLAMGHGQAIGVRGTSTSIESTVIGWKTRALTTLAELGVA